MDRKKNGANVERMVGVRVPASLRKRAKELAASLEQTLQDTVTDAMKAGLRSLEESAKKRGA